MTPSGEILLFPCWKRVQEAKKLPAFFTRLLWVSDVQDRRLVAYLSLVTDQARLVVRWEENGVMVAPVLSKPADGISTLGRAMQWAEWIISDLEASAQPRKRGRAASKPAPLEREAA